MSINSQALTVVVGMGEVGKPLHAILSAQNPAVKGIDIEPVTINEPVRILHVCFPFLEQAAFQEQVAYYAKKYNPGLIVINSTVLPGTTRAIEALTAVACVYSPVRGKHTKMVDDMKLYTKFAAGTNAGATQQVLEHFQQAGLQAEALSTPEALELAKLLETTYFGLLIAWAQEMNRFSEALQADYLELGKFFREIAYLPKVLFQPGIIGGHCVLPNIALLQQRFESEFLQTIQSSNESRKAELNMQQEPAPQNRLQPITLENANR